MTLEDIQQSISSDLVRLNERIESKLLSSNEMMNAIVKNYLKTKGKQIRPIIVMLSAKLFGDINDTVIAAASAVELLHNSSLIHDDVIDETKLRRGHPTVNSQWDNHIAVLTGDYFVSVALQEAIASGDIRIISSISSLGKLLSLGEIDQIYNARFHKLTEEAYFEIISHKTASLFVACAEMGCYAIGVDDDRLTRLSRFANLLGLCFQIKDDIFDYFTSEKIGKPSGNDLREGKITLPLLYALNNSTSPDRQAMVELSRKEELSTQDIDTLINFAKDNGGIEYAYATMSRLRAEAVEIMNQFPQSSTTQAFISIFDYIIDRDK